MLKTLIKPLNAMTPAEGKKKPPSWLIGIILLAILFLASGSLFEKKPQKNTAVDSKGIETQDYVKNLEEKLSQTLECIQGAGKVTVLLTLEGNGEKVLASDIRQETEEILETEAEESKHQREETVVFGKDGNGQSPYIIEEKFPAPSGVLVIAEGAGDARVRLEIYEAVKALFGLSPHRIKVAY